MLEKVHNLDISDTDVSMSWKVHTLRLSDTKVTEEQVQGDTRARGTSAQLENDNSRYNLHTAHVILLTSA